MCSDIRVRFAPSPTGYMHVGGARTALFNYLFARRYGGKFILRIEDTDRKRFQEGALEEIFQSLKWLGLDWDEGPDKGGKSAPYVQSERTDLYRAHVNRLIDKGLAYRCFCTPERLDHMRREQEKNRMRSGSGYDRKCRSLTPEEIAEKLKNNEPHVVRIKIPDNRAVKFSDLIRGEIEYQSDLLDDLVLLKSDGYPTYHLANVVDDHFMEISHVLRGDEWISSTPRHILIYEAFGWKPPIFAHMPVILAPGGGKLSKRKGAASVMDYKNSGFLPEALTNFLALLGWSPGDDREIMTLTEMIREFSLKKVSPKSAVFDEKKLEWMNGHYLAEKDSAELLPEVTARWGELGWKKEILQYDSAYLMKVVDLLKVRSKRIDELAERAEYFFFAPKNYEAKPARKHFRSESVPFLKKLADELNVLENFTRVSLEDLFRRLAEELNLSAGKLIHPSRLAVSGVSFGPGIFELLETIGKERVIERFHLALNWIENQSREELTPEKLEKK